MADYIIWRDDYSVGNKDIDDQHKRIIGIINAVFILVKDGGSEEDFWKALDGLKQYTIDHFKFEEGVLALAQYPGLQEHLLIHRKMNARTATLFVKRPGITITMLAEELLAMLKDWWVNHIRGVDALYAPYISGQNR
jgi:hemerythrin-like metal-binding protein